MNKKYAIKFLKKMRQKYPKNKNLKEDKNCEESTASEKFSSNNNHIPTTIVSKTQKLIDAGITDAKILHEKTNIPMEALAAMGLKVPVRDYVFHVNYTSSEMPINSMLSRMPVACKSESPKIPKAYMLTGLVSVKAVSPSDAIATFKSNIDSVNLSEILPDTIPMYKLSQKTDPYVDITNDPVSIESLTELNENGFINNIINTGLISPIAKHQGE